MDANKTYFQQLSLQMEELLKRYKNQYPKNLGALVRNAFPYMLMAVTLIVLPLAAVFGFFLYGNLALFLAMFFVIPVLIVFCVILLIKNNREKVVERDLPVKMEALKKQVEPYKEYSDVSKYLDGYNRQIAETDSSKKRHRNMFRTIIACFCLIVVAYVTGSLIWITSFNSCSNHSFMGDDKILGLEKNVPFLTLQPLKTDIGEGCKVESDRVDIFYSTDWLVLKEINISGASEGDLFRMIITDAEGRPVPNGTKFVFSGANNKKVLSYNFCRRKDLLSDGTVNFTSNSYECLEVCRYINEHKEGLRFLVEKIN